MRREAKVALAIAVSVVVGAVAYLIYRVQAVAKKYLYISAGEGGTTEPPPGTYTESLGENVTIKAVPNDGYTVGIWVVDGVDLGHQDSIAVTMDVDHTVIVTFWPGGQPPPTYPVTIQFPESPYYLSQHYKAGIDYVWGWDCPFSCQHLNCHPQKGTGETGYDSVSVKGVALDPAGKGVPNVDVAVWSSSTPDQYNGRILLNGEVHLSSNPLAAKTDENGNFYVSVQYATDMNWLCQQTCRVHGLFVEQPVKPCDKYPLPYLWISCSNYETLPAPYTIYAQCIGTVVTGYGQFAPKAVLLP